MADRKAFLLRLDPRVYEALQIWAKDELRSLNGQIEFLLRSELSRTGRSPGGTKTREKGPSREAPGDERA